MDQIGTLDLAWSQGYDGGKAAYITRDVVCFKCGNNVKFVAEDGHESVFPSPGEGLGSLAVHSHDKVFAISDLAVEPTVYIVQYPSFRTIAELKGGARLEYISLVFSQSKYIATVSGVPEYELTIWDYTTGTKLCDQELSHAMPTCISFNPGNWRHLCITTEKELSMWSIEQSHTEYVIHKKKVKLPSTDGNVGDQDEDRNIPTRASTRMSKVTINLPKSSIAAMKGDEAEKFEDYQDEKERVVPLSHAWCPTGDLFIGCAGGQLMQVDGESYSVKLLFNPGPRPVSAMSRLLSAKSGIRERSELEGQSSTSVGFQSMMAEGAVNCIALHKKGLYAAGEDGVLRHLELSANSVKLVDSYQIGVSITSMSFNSSHYKLALGSPKGNVHVFEPRENTMKPLFDVHFGKFVAVDTLTPGSEYTVTLREDGELQVWKMDTANLVCSLSIGWSASSMASSPLTHLVAVGTQSGHLFLCDLNQMDNPRIVHRIHLHQGPINHIVFNQNGHFLLTGSDDGCVFVLNGRPSEKFSPIGHIAMGGNIEALSVFLNASTKATKVVVTAKVSQDKDVGASKLVHLELPEDLTTDLPTKLASLKGDLRPDLIKKLNFNLATPSFGIVAAEGNVAFTMAQSTKYVNKITLPTEPPKKENSKDSYLRPVGEYPGHQLPGGRLLLSPHHKWLASVAADGKLCVRAVGALDKVLETNAHDYRAGGSTGLAYSADASRMFTVGGDGALVCFKWSYTSSGQSKAKSAVEAARARHTELMKEQQKEDEHLMAMNEWSIPDNISRPQSSNEKAEKEQSEKEAVIDKAIESDTIFSTPTPTPSSDATWLEVKELEAIQEEDKQYADLKLDLRTNLRDMRRKLQAMMKENEVIPDIEKLDPHEFDLDVEEQHRLQAEGDAEVARIREEKEFENLAKLYLTELIKKECWDDMVVKGRGVESFSNAIEVHNYPMKARSREALDRLDQVKTRRQIEMAELNARREFAEVSQKSSTQAARMRNYLLRQTLDRRMCSSSPSQSPSKAKKPKVGSKKTPEEGEEAEEEDDGRAKPSTTGSLAAEFGGDSELLYSQFELHTREQKMNQITLIEDCIHRIKMNFNKDFDEVYNKKEQEIAKIKDKNKRIKKILGDLVLPVEVYEPAMGIIEKPEMLMNVSDSEPPPTEEDSIAPLDKPCITEYSFFKRDKKGAAVEHRSRPHSRLHAQSRPSSRTPATSKGGSRGTSRSTGANSASRPQSRASSKDAKSPGAHDPLSRPQSRVGKFRAPSRAAEKELVKIEKFLYPEQRKKMEEEAKADEERRMREKGDNWRDRGLDQMMGGVLEVKKEDELKKDIPVPAFASKSEDEWTEDEKKAYEVYEKQVRDLQEEREKYRKQLEMELKKLQTLIQDGCQAFDEVLNMVFMKKIKTEMVVYQEELKILRLRYALLLEEELNNRETELQDLLEFKKELKNLSHKAVQEARKNCDAFREQYDILTAEDKVMDKAFKREFNDVPAVQLDHLHKLFRRRPRGGRAKGADTPTYDPSSGNPFADRPTSAHQNNIAEKALESALADLDKLSNAPEGVEDYVWQRMCTYRRQKIASEHLVKTKALVLAEMQAFLQKRQDEDELLKQEIEDIIQSLGLLKEDCLRFTCNLEVQLLLKQGQVEVDAGQFIHNYRNSILTHRTVVEDLNGKIRGLGESKISSMVESKDFRKGIIQLEWEHKKMTMEMEDLQNKMRDIQNLKVTREIQAFLNEEDYDAKKAQEISTLEQTILLQKQQHEKNLLAKKRAWKELRKVAKDKEEENDELAGDLEDLNVSVNERRNIDEVNADKRSDAGRDARYKEIVQRRKLVDLAKAQAQEVAVLRAEVERLRMRTFPALVQVEH